MSDEEKDLFSKLPDGFREKFTQQILSRTTPEDVVRMSVVSKSFLACANSDVVWDTFIPPHHTKRLLERFRNYSLDSSREVYFFLCTYADEDRRNPVLGVFLDKWSGKMCVNITHEKLAITQLETDYWKKSISWYPVLCHVHWFEVHGKIPTSRLSPETAYEAYFVFALSDYVCYGFHIPIEASVGIPGKKAQKRIYIWTLE
ncbi:F-box protein PP2-B10-like [Apium graveolens]|uniref:F-box protein PP2-B10-like n=1 Tax=Apium graveolens TaxID=4045 RepID=UPI003D7932DF